MEEKRQASIESILVALGEVKAISGNTESKVDELNKKVAIQNGRIGAMELREAEKKGYLRALGIIITIVTTIVTLVVIPMGLMLFQTKLRVGL